MIEVPIPKDIMRYKAKLIGPFTGRQVLSAGLCAGICGALYFTVYGKIPSDVFGFLCIILCIPCLALNFELYGMPFEQYITSTFLTSFFGKKRRTYRTSNAFYPLTEEYAEKLEAKKQGKKKKRKESLTYTAYR